MFLDGITDFIFVKTPPEKSDLIFLPGGNYPEAAREAARLWKEGWAPRILPSGRYSKALGHFSGDPGYETEWDYLKDILLSEGVPEEAILEEKEATFTWENAIFSKKVCRKARIRVKKAILCCQNWHARRCLMYYQQQFPQAHISVCPVSTRGITPDNWYLDPAKADLVLSEVERCGAQFHEIAKHAAEGADYETPDDWKSPFGRG